MSLTQDQIIRLQKLTALKHTENIDISSVVDFFSLLNAVHTDTLQTPSRSGQWTLLPRKDVVEEISSLPDELLKCSNQKKAAHQIVLGGIMHGE
jgi:Asp-tRNA(Asn)/Glu-tRNA(Gln) amidotransferase C subunit